MTQYSNEEINKLLCDCLSAIYCPRGKFYPKKDYGSLIQLHKADNEKYLLAYARQALADFSGVFIKAVKAEQNNLIFDLIINNEERTVTMPFEADI